MNNHFIIRCRGKCIVQCKTDTHYRTEQRPLKKKRNCNHHFFFVYFYVLLNDALGSSDYIASSDNVLNK